MRPGLTLRLAAAVAAIACALPAAAQWAWRDASGRMVYSDLPPPKSVSSKDIVRQPPAPPPRRETDRAAEEPSEPAADATAPAASTAPRPPASPAPTLADREIASRRQQQMAAENARKSAEEQAGRSATQENCERLLGYQRALEGGFRIARVNAAGQQEVLDDAARAAEIERTRREIDQNCR